MEEHQGAMSIPRFFNTAGPVKPEWHYCVSSLSRIDMENMRIAAATNCRLVARNARSFYRRSGFSGFPPPRTAGSRAHRANRTKPRWKEKPVGDRCIRHAGFAAKQLTNRLACAKETLILRRDTHIDQLADKLREDRVRRVVQPILAGSALQEIPTDDLQYGLDLGLIRQTEQGIAIANPIYQEIIPRELTWVTQESLKSVFHPDWIRSDGTLDVSHLLQLFQDFYTENGEAWAGRFAYQEAGSQLLLQAFLQRVINGKGRIEREYALGTGRTNLYLRWPHSAGVQKAAIEIKVLHHSLEKTIAQGLAQVFAYAQRCAQFGGNKGKTGGQHNQEGNFAETHLMIFHKDFSLPVQKRVFYRQEIHQGQPIAVWGMQKPFTTSCSKRNE